MSPTKVGDVVTVPVSGAAHGRRPCTWGQLDMWREMVESGDPAESNVMGGGVLAPGSTVADVTRVVGDLVARYEALRTRFHRTGDGGLDQEVVAYDEVGIELRELAGDPLATMLGWLPAVSGNAFDLAGETPLRLRVGTVDGEPRLVAFGLPHVAADFIGCRILFDELRRGLDGRPPLGTPGLNPREILAQEASDTGSRTQRRALAYWRGVLADAPPAAFEGPGQAPETPRYRRGGLTSRRIPRALDVLAARYGVGTTHVLLGAVALLLGRCTGRPHGVVRMVAGNRGRPELRHSVGTLTQETATRLEFRADRFEDLVRRARVSSLLALRNARYDPDAVAAAVADAGVELDLYVNDMWAARTTRGAPGFADHGGGTETSVFEWEQPLEHAGVAFFLETAEVLDDPAAVRVSLLTDTAHLPPVMLRRLLLALEELLVHLVDDDGEAPDRIRLRHDAAT